MTVARQSRLVRMLRVVPGITDDERSDALEARTNNVRVGPRCLKSDKDTDLGAGPDTCSLERKSCGVMKIALAGEVHEATMLVTKHRPRARTRPK